jgi:hypothetical protein
VPHLGELVGEQVALLRRLPGVERGRAGGIDRHGVEEHALGAVRVDGEQHGVLLLGGAAQEELPLPAPRGRRHDAGREQLAEPGP